LANFKRGYPASWSRASSLVRTCHQSCRSGWREVRFGVSALPAFACSHWS